jgi:hypothetical protein
MFTKKESLVRCVDDKGVLSQSILIKVIQNFTDTLIDGVNGT